jgi:hypothetical protein
MRRLRLKSLATTLPWSSLCKISARLASISSTEPRDKTISTTLTLHQGSQKWKSRRNRRDGVKPSTSSSTIHRRSIASRSHHVAAPTAASPRLGTSSTTSTTFLLAAAASISPGASPSRLPPPDRPPGRKVCAEEEGMASESAQPVWREEKRRVCTDSEG